MTDPKTETQPQRKLTRSRDDRYVGGVASGIARRFSIDPMLVRIAFVVSLAFGVFGPIGYLILLVMLPVEGDAGEPVPPVPEGRRNAVIVGTVVIGIFYLITLNSGNWVFGIGPGPLFDVAYWTLGIVALAWLIREARKGIPSEAFSDKPGPSAVPSPSQTAPTEVMPAATTAAGAPTPSATAPTGVYRQATAGDARTETLAEQQERSGGAAVGKIMTWFAVGLVSLIGLLILASISGWVTVAAGAIPMATVVVGIGIAMVVLAITGRQKIAIWLLPVALFVAIPMAVLSLAGIRLHGTYGYADEKPVTAMDIPGDGFKLAAGAMTIDMRRFDFQPGKTVELPVDSGLGYTQVIVPDDVCVTADVSGKAGLTDIRGTESSGVDVNRSITAAGSSSPRLHLDGEFQLGVMRVVDSTGYRAESVAGSDNYSYADESQFSRDQKAAQARAKVACEVPAPPEARPKAPSDSQSGPAGKTTKA